MQFRACSDCPLCIRIVIVCLLAIVLVAPLLSIPPSYRYLQFVLHMRRTWTPTACFITSLLIAGVELGRTLLIALVVAERTSAFLHRPVHTVMCNDCVVEHQLVLQLVTALSLGCVLTWLQRSVSIVMHSLYIS